MERQTKVVGFTKKLRSMAVGEVVSFQEPSCRYYVARTLCSRENKRLGRMAYQTRRDLWVPGKFQIRRIS